VSLPLLCEATSSTLLLSDTASGSRDDAAYEDETNNKDKTTATKKSNDGTAVDFIAPLKTRALRPGRSSRHFSTAKRQLLLLLLGAQRACCDTPCHARQPPAVVRERATPASIGSFYPRDVLPSCGVRLSVRVSKRLNLS